ncbi:hypothetical protein C8J57DRAFT_1058075 [Mycena rebaudengoi]|nr:hypothetical protein C8J57DRAFT_1092714 [Mycena rebaudengoi]KAJ7279906.1 hypothetical protein C8J57DRAFT_1058075 [Mycena rebaudengoi]
MGPRIPSLFNYGSWRLSDPTSLAAPVDRKRKNTGSSRLDPPPLTKKARFDLNSNGEHLVPNGISSPIGPRWDSGDYSCAYDSVFGILYNIWLDNSSLRSHQFSSLSNELASLVRGFECIATHGRTIEDARDEVRSILHSRDPVNFPYGPNYSSVDLLSSRILPSRECGRSTIRCTLCNYQLPGTISTFSPHLTLSLTRSLHRAEPDTIISLKGWFRNHFNQRAQRCPVCLSVDKVDCRMQRSTTLLSVPSLLSLNVISVRVQLDPFISFMCNGTSVVLFLRGIVYHGASHFTSRIISSRGDIWFHDGITTMNTSKYEGNLKDLQSLSSLHECNGRNAVLAVYAVCV